MELAADLQTELMRHARLPAGWQLLQSGFGRTAPDNALSAGTRNHKLALFADDGGARPANMYDELIGQNEDVIRLQSTTQWTSLPGDSGGPLFAVNEVSGKVVVVGVTLGSEVFPTQQAEQQAGVTAQTQDGTFNNGSISLMRLYRGWAGEARTASPIVPLWRKTWAELVG